MTFYLLPLEDVESEPPTAASLSQSTIDLCLSALISAQYRENWRYDLDQLTDLEWEKAEAFLTTAIVELSEDVGSIDGGGA